MSRPWWLYRAGGRVPVITVGTRSPRLVGAEDVALCGRLIAAFAAITREDAPAKDASGIWRELFYTYQPQLAEILEVGDARELAGLLASMFQEQVVWGMTGDHGIRYHGTRMGLRILSLKTLDTLVSLAESLGVVSVESPGQGQAGLAFDGGIAELMAKVDRVLGFHLDFPNVGAPYGLMVNGRLITPDTPEQIYVALRLDQARVNHLPRHSENAIEIVEVGGGYGGMCYWFLRAHPHIARYTLIDLPIMNVLQGYFLAQALGHEKVSFFGKDPALLQILPDSALKDVNTPFDIFVNKESMPEMPHATVTSYLEWGRANCGGVFFSYNQETKAEWPVIGVRQGVVSEQIEQVGGFDRVRRDHSWVHRGYVEEIYVTRARTADGARKVSSSA